MLSRRQWPRDAAQARKSLARQADGPVCSHWSMSACPQAASVGAAAAEPGEQARGGADAVAGVRGRGARPGGGRGAGPQSPHHLPGGVGLHQPPVGGRLDRLEDRGEPLPGAGEFLVPGRQRPGGGEHVPQVVGGPPAGAVVQRLVADGQPAGGHVGEQPGAGAVAQPVQCAARLAGGGDRVEHAVQLHGDDPGAVRQQIAGAAAQAAPCAAAVLVELVFGAAVGAGAEDRDLGAIGAGVSGRAGRGDQPPLLPAARARPPVLQGRAVTRVADRSLRPAGLRRPVLPAARADGGGPRRARGADRLAGCRVGARAPLPAYAAGGFGHPVAVDADVRLPVPAAHRDRRGVPAPAAFAVAARVITAPADLADRPAVLVEPGRRLGLAAGGAGPGELPAAAPLAHPAAVTAEQRLAGPPAGRARRDGQGS